MKWYELEPQRDQRKRGEQNRQVKTHEFSNAVKDDKSQRQAAQRPTGKRNTKRPTETTQKGLHT